MPWVRYTFGNFSGNLYQYIFALFSLTQLAALNGFTWQRGRWTSPIESSRENLKDIIERTDKVNIIFTTIMRWFLCTFVKLVQYVGHCMARPANTYTRVTMPETLEDEQKVRGITCSARCALCIETTI